MSGMDRHAEDISHSLASIGEELEHLNVSLREPRLGWLQLPSGQFINAAHLAIVRRQKPAKAQAIFNTGWSLNLEEEDGIALGLWLVGESGDLR